MRTLPAQPNKTSNFIGQWSNDDASDPHFRAGGATSSPPVADAPRCRGGPPGRAARAPGQPGNRRLALPVWRTRRADRAAALPSVPGRWHFRCPSCGKLKGILVDVGADTLQAPLHVLQIGWVCRTCAGLPRSRAWPLNSHQRLDNVAQSRRREPPARREGARLAPAPAAGGAGDRQGRGDGWPDGRAAGPIFRQ